MLVTIPDNNSKSSSFANKIVSDNIVDIVGICYNDIFIRDIENLLTVANLAKFKKSDLIKSKKSNFVKANFSEMDFFILETKKVFIHL